MVKVKATAAINHDGEFYNPGETLDVSKAQADALREAGVVESGGSREDAARDAEVVSTSEPTRQELLAEAEAEGLKLEGVNANSKKDDIKAAIEAARAARDAASNE